jgi:transposase
MESVVTAAGVATGMSQRKKRQLRSSTEKLRIVEESLVPGTSVALVARKNGVNANQVFGWRKLHFAGRLIRKKSKSVTATAARLLPVTVTDAGQQLGMADATRISAPVRCATSSGSIHIQFSKAQVRVEGSADASALRVVLECLLR